MKFDSVEQEIGMTVDWCVILWGANGIPVERVAEMKGELEDHLREGVEDGKSVNDVTGGDVGAFAGAWAIEDRPRTTLQEQVMDYAWMLATSAMFVSAFGHLWYFSPTYTVKAWSWYATPIFFSVSAGVFEMPGVPRGQQESSLVRMLISVGVGALAGALMAAVNLAVHLGGVSSFFEWSWISTLVVVLLGAPLLKNRRRTDVLPILEEREEQERRGAAG